MPSALAVVLLTSRLFTVGYVPPAPLPAAAPARLAAREAGVEECEPFIVFIQLRLLELAQRSAALIELRLNDALVLLRQLQFETATS